MKKLVLLLMLFSEAIMAQKPFVRLGGSLSAGPGVALNINPMVGVQINRNVQVGSNIAVSEANGRTADYINVYVKYYPREDWFKYGCKPYIQNNIGYSLNRKHKATPYMIDNTEDSINPFGVIGINLGITATFGKVMQFYIEPNLGFIVHNMNNIQYNGTLGINLGINIK